MNIVNGTGAGARRLVTRERDQTMASNKLSLYRQKRDFTRTDEPSTRAL
jgi:hypothetical protein